MSDESRADEKGRGTPSAEEVKRFGLDSFGGKPLPPARRDFLAELEKRCEGRHVGDITSGDLQAIALFRIEDAIRSAGVYSAIGSGVGSLLAALGKTAPSDPLAAVDAKKRGH